MHHKLRYIQRRKFLNAKTPSSEPDLNTSKSWVSVYNNNIINHTEEKLVCVAGRIFSRGII